MFRNILLEPISDQYPQNCKPNLAEGGNLRLLQQLYFEDTKTSIRFNKFEQNLFVLYFFFFLSFCSLAGRLDVKIKVRYVVLLAAILFFLFVFQCSGCPHSLCCDWKTLKEFLSTCSSQDHVTISTTCRENSSNRDEGGIKRIILKPCLIHFQFHSQ